MKGLIASLFATTALVSADVYMHNPRGSNNRLNEANNNRANGNRLFDSQNNNAGGYNVGPTMYYYVGSRLNVEWTNQHGCGFAHDNLVCNLVMQYMCNPESLLMRNGGTTETANDPEDVPEDIQYGKHETYEYYADCKTRMRNMGLFTADQQVNGNTARFTRQNPNGNRRGYECPEERDYYPYWHPTPWRDIVILTDEFGPASKTQVNRCPYYQSESQNTMSKGYCKDAPWWNNAVDCARGASTPFKTTGDDKRDEEEQKKRKAMTGEWLDYGKWDMPSPECWPTQWSRDNHLGNGIDGYALNYNWTIPDTVYSKCVFRLRYNISTGDYDPWTINSTWNGAMSPIKDNPELKDFYGLQLAINTDQFGRTFQDRSHIFEIRARPSTIPRTTLIQNINVRGKRGNIVQVYPGVEYDFIPNVALVKPGDYVHFQWTGSNTNPQGNDGEGVAGSDKSNIVQIKENDQARSYPAHALDATMFEDATSDKWKNPVEIYFKLSGAPGGGKLNEASTYFDGGLIKLVTKGTFNYMSTRNNNFSNRDQKARLIVSDNAFLADGYNVGAGWRFNSEDPTRSSSKKLSKGALIAAIVAPCAVLVIAVAGYMVMKKPASDSKRVPLRN